MTSQFITRKAEGEITPCDSCDCAVPTAVFERGPGAVTKTPRLLCEFCCTTMASRHTEYPSTDTYGALRAEIWKASAAVFNLLKHPPAA